MCEAIPQGRAKREEYERKRRQKRYGAKRQASPHRDFANRDTLAKNSRKYRVANKDRIVKTAAGQVELSIADKRRKLGEGEQREGAQEAKCAREVEQCPTRADYAGAAATQAELVQRRSAPGHEKRGRSSSMGRRTSGSGRRRRKSTRGRSTNSWRRRITRARRRSKHSWAPRVRQQARHKRSMRPQARLRPWVSRRRNARRRSRIAWRGRIT